MATTVVLAEDSFIVREGIKMLLEESGYALLAVAEDYDGLMAAVAAEPPQVVLTDIRMPPTRTDEGVRAAREIRAAYPDVDSVERHRHGPHRRARTGRKPLRAAPCLHR